MKASPHTLRILDGDFPDPPLFSQFLVAPEIDVPEIGLYKAIFADTLRCVCGRGVAKDLNRAQRRRDALEWFRDASPSKVVPLGWGFVADVLGLDAEHFYRRLVTYLESGQTAPRIWIGRTRHQKVVPPPRRRPKLVKPPSPDEALAPG
jgi:hypothetical protein